MAYIYQIVNDINQKIYIGKTEFSIEKRMNFFYSIKNTNTLIANRMVMVAIFIKR